MDFSNPSPHMGKFSFAEDELFGQLVIDGKDSRVNLISDERIHVNPSNKYTVYGLLHDNTHITLIDSLSFNEGYFSSKTSTQYRLSFLPHYILTGNRVFDPSQDKVSTIKFTTKQTHRLFYDTGIFGHLTLDRLVAKELIETHTKSAKRQIEIGDYPDVYYYSGKNSILNVKLSWGMISIEHSISGSLPSSSGININNNVYIKVKFHEPMLFFEALNKASYLKIFNDFNLGIHEKFEELSIYIDGEDELSPPLSVYICMQEDGDGNLSESVHPSEVLVNGGFDPDEYSKVLRTWMQRETEWNDCRWRQSTTMIHARTYSADRLVASANMFDLIPDNDVYPLPKVNKELLIAVEHCKAILNKVPHCQVRDGLLGSLGRVGKHSLASKVKKRADIILNELGGKLPKFHKVIREAIKTRNYFVHGTPGNLNSKQREHCKIFFTNTLEFIFVASDFIQSGWDISKWEGQTFSFDHPLSYYLRTYSKNLELLESFLHQNKSSN